MNIQENKLIWIAVGFLVFLVGFLLSNIEKISVVEKLIFPKIYFLNIALDKLDNEERINKNDPEFKYISATCSSPDPLFTTAYDKGTTTINFTRIEDQSNFGIHAVLGGRRTIESICNSKDLKQEINSFKNKNLLIIAFIVSTLGYLLPHLRFSMDKIFKR